MFFSPATINDKARPHISRSLALLLTMHLSLPLLQGLLIAGAAASRQRIQRQGSDDGREGPVEPDTAADCTFFDTARSAADDCAHFASWWGISEEDFIKMVRIGYIMYPPGRFTFLTLAEPECEVRLQRYQGRQLVLHRSQLRHPSYTHHHGRAQQHGSPQADQDPVRTD